MFLKNANLCIGEAKSHEKPDEYLCSLAEKVALNFFRRDSFDFQKEGAEGLRFYGRVYGCRNIKDGSMVVTKPIERIVFIDDETVYAYVGGKSFRIDSFSDSFYENMKLLASSSLARDIILDY